MRLWKFVSEESILWLTLNRPHNLNALSAKMVEELEDFLSNLRDDHETRVVIMRGAGRGFCAGLDLKEQNRGGPEALGRSTTAVYESQRRMSDLTVAIRRAPQPFIAAIKGPAAGGGFALALACDCRIAGESTRMNAAFIRIGLTACDMGVSYMLPRAVGSSVAAELLLTGASSTASARSPPAWFPSWCPIPKSMRPRPSSRTT